MWRAIAVLGGAILILSGCQTTPSEPTDKPLDPKVLRQMDQAVAKAVETDKIPGGVLWLEHRKARYTEAYGFRSLAPTKEPMTEGTLFDVASLTKVMATLPAIMWLWEEGKLELDASVREYIPEFKGPEKRKVTLRHLLTHTSGLPAGLSLSTDWEGYEKGIELAANAELSDSPGEVFRYSDVNFILLGEIVRRVSGERLDRFVDSRIYPALRMDDTGFLPPASGRPVAPTERIDGGILRGRVHDPIARRMGGVAGHAGLFTTAEDMARFARMMLNKGRYQGRQLFDTETVARMTQAQPPESVEAVRGLGWDIDSPYSSPRGKLFPTRTSYGHTGFTGGSIWIDPASETFIIFLSNRVHPDGDGEVVPLRRRLGTLTAQAVQSPPKAQRLQRKTRRRR